MMPSDTVENTTEPSTSSEPRTGFFRDEQGNLSMARVLVIVTTSWDYALIAQPGSHSPEEIWLMGVITALNYLWAFGPRITQYMVPAIKALGSWFTSVFTRNPLYGGLNNDIYGSPSSSSSPKAY